MLRAEPRWKNPNSGRLLRLADDLLLFGVAVLVDAGDCAAGGASFNSNSEVSSLPLVSLKVDALMKDNLGDEDDSPSLNSSSAWLNGRSTVVLFFLLRSSYAAFAAASSFRPKRIASDSLIAVKPRYT